MNLFGEEESENDLFLLLDGKVNIDDSDVKLNDKMATHFAKVRRRIK